MPNQYVVARGGSILLPSGKILQAGSIIVEGRDIVAEGVSHSPMPRRKIEDHLRAGYLRHIGVLREEGPISPEDFTDRPPGSVIHPPLPGPDKEDALRTSGGGIMTSARDKIPSISQVSQVTSKWTLDPEKLTGKGIDELNIMVAERDSSIPPFSTEEEAIAWLSQDREQVEAVKASGSGKTRKDSQIAAG